VFIVGVKFDVLAYREQAASIEIRGTPFLILTNIIGLGSDIRNEVI
jgi:hypothetical protein